MTPFPPLKSVGQLTDCHRKIKVSIEFYYVQTSSGDHHSRRGMGTPDNLHKGKYPSEKKKEEEVVCRIQSTRDNSSVSFSTFCQTPETYRPERPCIRTQGRFCDECRIGLMDRRSRVDPCTTRRLDRPWFVNNLLIWHRVVCGTTVVYWIGSRVLSARPQLTNF